jgi:Fic family protein
VPATISAYVPSRLRDRAFRLSHSTLTSVSDAERVIAAAQEHADHAGVSTIAVQLMRSEAIASSQIEGVETPSSRSLAHELAKRRAPGARSSGPAVATIANLEAVRSAYRRAATATGPLTTADILATHEALAGAEPSLASHAGELRSRQNWIGADPYTPVDADFIPPPARFVAGLLDDLCAWCNRDEISPLLRAAVAHAQFETIHPFVDGNGRVGRTLIGELLCRGRLARDVIPPVSLVLSGRRNDYIAALTSWRFDEGGADVAIGFIADCAYEAADASRAFADDVATLQDRWRSLSAHRRSDSAAAKIIERLPACPVITASDAAETAGVSEQAARNALNQLEADGVLAQVTRGRRNRAWESVGLFALVDDLERRLSRGTIAAAATQT